MRSAFAIIPLFALMRLGLADLDWNDVPNTCRSQCEPVMNIFTDCAREVGTDMSVDFFRNGTLDVDGPGKGPGKDKDNDRDDDPVLQQRYVDCVCNKQNARTDIPNCSDCLIRNGYRDKDVGDFVRACRFTEAPGMAPNTTATPTGTLTTTNAGSANNNNNNQPGPPTGAASKLGVQNVLVAAALVAFPAALL